MEIRDSVKDDDEDEEDRDNIGDNYKENEDDINEVGGETLCTAIHNNRPCGRMHFRLRGGEG